MARKKETKKKILSLLKKIQKNPQVFKRLGKKKSIIILIIILLFSFWKINSARKAKFTVEITKVEKRKLTESISASGEITADKYANMSFPTSGKIIWLGVKEGDSVKKWQGLASLDKTPLDVAYQQAKSNLRKYEANLDAVYDSLQGKEKTETYSERNTRTTAETLKDYYYDALRTTEYNLKNATLIAPFNGIITNFANGISEGINISPATTIFSVVDPETVYFEADINETDVTKLKTGQKAIIKLDAYPDESFVTKIERISFESITTSTGGTGYKVKVALPENKDVKFRLGMNGDINFIIDEKENIITVPQTALGEEENISYVWVVNPKSRARKTTVETGSSSINEIEITSGLKEGDIIIIRPPNKLKNNDKVEIKDNKLNKNLRGTLKILRKAL